MAFDHSTTGPGKRIVVWVQHRADRPYLSLEWLDPDTGKRKSKSAETCNPIDAERKRADLEADLNHGRYVEASRMTWERFGELFEAEYVAPLRQNTRRNFEATLDHFEQICNPRSIGAINERTISLYAAGLRKLPGRGRKGELMMPSTIKVRLQYLHTALSWAVSQKLLAAVPRFPAVKVPSRRPSPSPPSRSRR